MSAIHIAIAVIAASVLEFHIAPLIDALQRAKQRDDDLFDADAMLCEHLRQLGCCRIDACSWLYEHA